MAGSLAAPSVERVSRAGTPLICIYRDTLDDLSSDQTPVLEEEIGEVVDIVVVSTEMELKETRLKVKQLEKRVTREKCTARGHGNEIKD